jgi:hypothetical protein
MLVSHAAYIWFCTLATGGLSAAWLVVDALRLRRALTEDRSDPVVRDRIFGSVIGMAICVIGVAGTVAYHL